MAWSLFRARNQPYVRQPSKRRLVVELLEDRTLPANLAPLAPVITEPASNGTITSAFDTHMVTAPFSDPNPGDTHAATDWQIWTTGAAPQPVWLADNMVDTVLKYHVHLADGAFVNALAGRRQLAYDTNYQLRIRVKDSSGDTATQWSPWSTRTFHTAPELQPEPGVGTWAIRQPGYKVEQVAGGLQLPVNIAFNPNAHHGHDPLFYVTELYGQIKVVTGDGAVSTYASELLNFDPTGQFPGSGEQGVAGVVVDPASGDLFVTMVYDSGGTHYPRIDRLHSTDGGFTMATRTTVLAMPNEPMGASHQISNISFGPDEKLYVHVGDGFDDSVGQNLASFRGKILRMNLNGTAPADNPFYNAADGITARDYVYAYGFRNPFGGAWRLADGAHYEVENGPNVDRFAKVVAGRNYGYDGSDTSMTQFALYNWSPAHAPTNLVFLDGTAWSNAAYPAAKNGHAFVAESGSTAALGPQTGGKRISEFVLDANGNRVSGPTPLIEYNGTGYSSVVGLAAGPDGLYFTDLYAEFGPNPIAAAAHVYRVRYIGTAAPAAPSNLQSIAVGASRIDLIWADNSENEEGFKVEQSVDGTNFTPIATVGRGVRAYSVLGLQAATKYYFRVRAFNADFGNGAYSAIANATTSGQAIVPAVPSSVVAAGGIGKVQLTWATAANAISYNVYRGVASGGQGATPVVSGITTTAFLDVTASAGTTYFYRVTAVNSAGESARSSEVSGTATSPAAPLNVAATAGVNQVSLAWNTVAGADTYNLYRATASGGEGSTPYRTGITGLNFTDIGLVAGTTYYYQVSAVAGTSAGARSAEVSATAQAPPAIDLHINFQPAAAPIPNGYLVDAGLAFAPRGNGFSYGWDRDASGGARDRNDPTSPDQRYDTLNHLDGTWEIALPNGAYAVHLVAGDASYLDSVHKINVENALVINGTPTEANKWIEGTAIVNVTDGRLTISAAAGAVNDKINYIDITSSALTAPAAPTNLTATSGVNQVALTWNPVSGASSYNIYRATTSGGQGTTPYQTGVTSASYTDASAAAGATYYYAVSAVNLVGESARSSEASATPTAPPAPGAFEAHVNFQPAGAPVPGGYVADTGVGFGARGNGLTYGWNQDVTGAARDRNNSSSPDQRYDTLIHIDGAAWEIAVPNGAYRVRIVAGDPSYTDSVYRINAEGFLAVSGTPTEAAHWVEGTITVTISDGRLTIAPGAGSSNGKIAFIDITSETQSPPSVPVAPTLTATGSAGQIALSWSASAGATSYNINRATTSGGAGATPYRSGLTATAFVDTSVTAGTTYFYQVSAVNAAGASPRSNEASATPIATPELDVHINFQPATAPIHAGYLVDSGAIYGARAGGLTYGWNSNNAGSTRDRNSTLSADQRYDTLIHFGSNRWEISVPNGTYNVHVVAGDASYVDSVHRINAENVLLLSGTPTAAAHWIEATGAVTVADGRLTLTVGSGGANVKINYIDITSASTSSATAEPAAISLTSSALTLDPSATTSTSKAAVTAPFSIAGWTIPNSKSGSAWRSSIASLVLKNGVVTFALTGMGSVSASLGGTARTHHVAAIYDGVLLKLYVDGKLLKQAKAGALATAPPSTLADSNTLLTDPTYFTRVLSASEIAALSKKVPIVY